MARINPRTAARYAARYGSPETAPGSPESDAGADSDAMTKKELRAALDASGVEYSSRASKDELIALYEGGD